MFIHNYVRRVAHPTDLPLVPINEDQIKILTKNHPTHKVILVRDFNRDLLLVGHLDDNIPQTPKGEDKKWAQIMPGLALHPIHKNETFS